MNDLWNDAGYDSLTDIQRYYHASPSLLLPGTVLTPQAKKNYACSGPHIYLTDSPEPHYTVVGGAREHNWLVYQVEPLSEVRLGCFDDLICDSARVLDCVGPVSLFPGTSEVLLKAKADELPPTQANNLVTQEVAL